MNVQELLAVGGGLLLVMTLVQIAPIKVNPWSFIGKLITKGFTAIGKAFNAEVTKELAEVKGKLSELEKHNSRQDREREEDKALDARRRILQFADEIRRKVRHSEEHFNNVFEDINYYKTYCREHADFENDRARVSIKIIEETYEKCSRENDFL